MALAADVKSRVIGQYRVHQKDTGSPEVQVALISKRIESAQRTVEAQNFDSRKHLLEYDDVMNKQREAVYGLRRQLLEGMEQKEYLLDNASGRAVLLVYIFLFP